MGQPGTLRSTFLSACALSVLALSSIRPASGEGAEQKPSDVVRAKRFELVDEQGNVQAAVLVGPDGAPVLMVRQKDGRFRALLLTELGGVAAPQPATQKPPDFPPNGQLRTLFLNYFHEDPEVKARAVLEYLDVLDVAFEGTTAYVKYELKLRWRGDNPGAIRGPLKGAPGKKGETVQYNQVFAFRRWSKGWAIEDR